MTTVYDLCKCIKDLSIHVENAYSNVIGLYIYQHVCEKSSFGIITSILLLQINQRKWNLECTSIILRSRTRQVFSAMFADH